MGERRSGRDNKRVRECIRQKECEREARSERETMSDLVREGVRERTNGGQTVILLTCERGNE